MTKTEHRAESWAYAKALDKLALPRIYEMGQGPAYAWAGEQLKAAEKAGLAAKPSTAAAKVTKYK